MAEYLNTKGRRSEEHPHSNSMSYRHDIFLSYKRHPETLKWIKDHFLPLLDLRVSMELGRQVDIFVDDQIDAGTSWPQQLGVELSASRILLPLWTRTYFTSKWCTCEMSNMMAREGLTGCRTLANPRGIIVPAIIHDGDTFPAEIGHINHIEIQKCFNVRMSRESKRAEDLDDILMQHAPAVATAISNAPDWQSNWSDETAATFFRLFHLQDGTSQDTVPRFSGGTS